MKAVRNVLKPVASTIVISKILNNTKMAIFLEEDGTIRLVIKTYENGIVNWLDC